MSGPKCIGIAGWKNSGKTQLACALVEHLSAMGYVVSTLKHAHHAFDLDTPGTDSFRHRAAGAREVALVSANRWAIQHQLQGEPEPDFQTMVNRMSACDLLVVEGYKREPIAKIEIIGPDPKFPPLWREDPNVIAVACDDALPDCPLPQFRRSQVIEIANVILKKLELAP